MVNISLYKDGALIDGTSSDKDGYYTIKPIPPGTYTVEVSFIGYNTIIQNNVLISPNKIKPSFYEDLEEVLSLRKVAYFQLRLKNYPTSNSE